jgi:hypothetical protein
VLRDASESCCLDPAADPLCTSRCRAECRIITPGRGQIFGAAIQLDSSGAPSCALPTYQNGGLTCTRAVRELLVEVVLDSYLLLATRAAPLVCEPETQLTLPSAQPQVLHLRPKQRWPSQRFSAPYRITINGTDFHPGLGAKDAACRLYDSSNALKLELAVEYERSLSDTQVSCLLGTSSD